jgi:hypothetical protein
MTDIGCVKCMRFVGKSKISKIHPKPNTSYPLLRLLQAFNDFVGKTAHIFETEHDDQQAFLVVLGKSEGDVEEASSQVIQPVMQLEAEVTRQHSENNVENRLSKLESEIRDIKELILRNADTSDEKTRNSSLELKQTIRARGLGGYDVAFTRRRSPVRIRPSPFVFGFF